MQHFTHDSVRGDYRHIGLNAIPASLVDEHRTRQLAAASTDDLRRQSLRNELFLEAKQCLQTPRLIGVLTDARLLQVHAFDLCLEAAVLGAHTAQVEIVMPNVAAGGPYPIQRLFKRSDRSHRPNADQTRRFAIARPLDLHSQAEHLSE